MIDITNKKYELIDILEDGETTMLSDDYYKYLLVHSVSNDEEAEEFRIDSEISKEDFYSTLIETIKDISLEDSKNTGYMANYIYNNHEKAREIIKGSWREEFFVNEHFVTNASENMIQKYKPAKCLYDNKIINSYIEYIYVIVAGGAEWTVFFGEYK